MKIADTNDSRIEIGKQSGQGFGEIGITHNGIDFFVSLGTSAFSHKNYFNGTIFILD